MKIIDVFAKNEITLDYRWDEDEEDFGKTRFLGVLEDDEDRFKEIIENVKMTIGDTLEASAGRTARPHRGAA